MKLGSQKRLVVWEIMDLPLNLKWDPKSRIFNLMELLHLKRESSQQDWNAINGSEDNYLASSVKGGFVIIW